MPAPSSPDRPASRPASARHTFLAIFPTIHSIARVHFRRVRCPATRDDLIAEAVALGWVWCTRLVARGKDPAAFPVSLAWLAARAAGSGRRVCGQVPAADVFSPAARSRHGGPVLGLSDDLAAGAVFREALADNTQSPVPVQVQVRQDLPAWLGRLPRRHRRMVGLLALGHRTRDVAARFGVSPARVSQLRRRFHDGYLSFLADRPGG